MSVGTGPGGKRFSVVRRPAGGRRCQRGPGRPGSATRPRPLPPRRPPRTAEPRPAALFRPAAADAARAGRPTGGGLVGRVQPERNGRVARLRKPVGADLEHHRALGESEGDVGSDLVVGPDQGLVEPAGPQRQNDDGSGGEATGEMLLDSWAWCQADSSAACGRGRAGSNRWVRVREPARARKAKAQPVGRVDPVTRVFCPLHPPGALDEHPAAAIEVDCQTADHADSGRIPLVGQRCAGGSTARPRSWSRRPAGPLGGPADARPSGGNPCQQSRRVLRRSQVDPRLSRLRPYVGSYYTAARFARYGLRSWLRVRDGAVRAPAMLSLC